MKSIYFCVFRIWFFACQTLFVMKSKHFLFFPLAFMVASFILSSCMNQVNYTGLQKDLKNNWLVCNADSVRASGIQIIGKKRGLQKHFQKHEPEKGSCRTIS